MTVAFRQRGTRMQKKAGCQLPCRSKPHARPRVAVGDVPNFPVVATDNFPQAAEVRILAVWKFA